MVATAAASGTIAGGSLGLARCQTSTLVGLDAHAISVEVVCTRGPSFFQMVGLPDTAVREARVRVASALAQLDILIDEHALTINLAPADLKKSGASLDVAIALAVLAALKQLPAGALSETLVLGELGLSGELRPVRGVLPQLEAARTRGVESAIVPKGNAAEAGLVRGLRVLAARNITEALDHFRGELSLPEVPATEVCPKPPTRAYDLSDVRGQGPARRSLEIAAAGGHNVLLVGPPGGGKTLLARLLPTILPPLSYREAVEATAIHSVAGLVDAESGVVQTRPFRAPHHSISEAGLIGGGDPLRPGEVSLAHHGVLFLDELAEFPRSVLESLRQPLEDGVVHVARARSRAWFPARSVLVAATNPCPCGYWGHATLKCSCTEYERRRYKNRLSGPLLDRIDLHVQVPPVALSELSSGAHGERSSAVRERVVSARALQLERCEAGTVNGLCNATLTGRELEVVAKLDPRVERDLARLSERVGLSARAYVRVLRVARTIADLDGSELTRSRHVSEALQGRLVEQPRPGSKSQNINNR